MRACEWLVLRLKMDVYDELDDLRLTLLTAPALASRRSGFDVAEGRCLSETPEPAERVLTREGREDELAGIWS